MGARRTINRYRETPSGHDYDDVLKRGKVFYRDCGVFEMVPFRNKDNKVVRWSAESGIIQPFKRPEGTRIYSFNEKRKRWIEVFPLRGDIKIDEFERLHLSKEQKRALNDCAELTARAWANRKPFN